MSSGVRRQLLKVDGERCQGHNRCRVIAPELIEVDDLGFAHARGQGLVAPELAEKARLAVRNCPEFALSLVSAEEGESS